MGDFSSNMGAGAVERSTREVSIGNLESSDVRIAGAEEAFRMLKRSVLAAGLAVGLVLMHPSARAHALQGCVLPACAQITVAGGSEPVSVPISGGSGSVTVSFQQAPPVAPVGQGPDDIAAIAFSIGLTGDGSGNPLVFACDGGQLQAGAVAVNSAIDDDFAVVVENESCNARERCLCPEGDQERDDFVNIVVYGPKNIPEGGPVTIPRLPNGGLVTLNLRAGAGVSEDDEFDLHVYCEQDNGTPAKPEFAANLSIGDQAAIDQTADRGADRSKIVCNSGRVKITGGATPCVGDCDGNGTVAINELIRGVNIALGNADVSTCLAMDANGNGTVAINELIQGVNNALNGCPS